MTIPQLLVEDRLFCPNGAAGARDARSEFERDFDRVVFSTPFRRLHGKTQVFPLPESDMTHTRLTHSLEASCVGRSLGRRVGAALEKRDARIDPNDVAAAAAAATLAHDLGNPPFGHSGERAIQHYFATAGERWLQELTDLQKSQLLSFDGNALGFRILTNQKPSQTSNLGGFALTSSTLAAFSKYPWLTPNADGKFGIFEDDRAAFEAVARSTELVSTSDGTWSRHPLAYISEAADDICYRLMDLEDGFKMGLVSYDEAADILLRVAADGDESTESVDKIVAEDQRIGFLRAKAIGSLVAQATQVVSSDLTAVMVGSRPSLLTDVTSTVVLKKLKDLSRTKIYSHRPVLEIEAAGFEVLGVLLDRFLEAVLGEKDAKRNIAVARLIPTQFVDSAAEKWSKATRILNVCEYVSSMTDSHAIDTFRTLSGISLPNYRP